MDICTLCVTAMSQSKGYSPSNVVNNGSNERFNIPHKRNVKKYHVLSKCSMRKKEGKFTWSYRIRSTKIVVGSTRSLKSCWLSEVVPFVCVWHTSI